MPDAIDKAEELYVAARAAARAVMLDLNATQAQIDDATAARERMWHAYRDAILDDIRQRTAMLKKLIAELKNVRQSVQVNPLGDALDKIDGVLAAINGALQSENPGAGGGGS